MTTLRAHLLPILQGAWAVHSEMAPYLLLGLLVAGLLSVYLSAAWVERHLGGSGIGPVVKGSLLGVPMPLCSCGVIPVGASIRRHGASRGATASFLISTPQTGVDSILVTWSLLGPIFAIFRPVAAFFAGILGGGAISWLIPEEKAAEAAEAAISTSSSEDDCGGEACSSQSDADDGCGDDCCDSAPKAGRFQQAMTYGFVTLPKDIGWAMILGILVAGVIGAVVPEDYFQSTFGVGVLAKFVMLAIGIPLYVCSSGSVPMALGFIHAGFSPGAAAVFLISGPATNAATITTIWKVLGKGTAILYLITLGVTALASGFALDELYAWIGKAGLEQALVEHAHIMDSPALWKQASGVILLVVLAHAFWPRTTAGQEDAAVTEANTVRLAVNGMTCSHCQGAVERALREAPGVTGVQVSLDEKRAVVMGENLDPQALADIVSELGYEAKPEASE